MKSILTSVPELRRRLFKSFAVGGILTAVFVFGFVALQNQTQINGAPAFFRHVFEFNGSIWHGLQSTSRLSVTKTDPPPGTPPRVNGDIGLTSSLAADDSITVQSGDREFEVSLAEIARLNRSSATTDFKCVEGWSRVVQYAGVKFSDFMEHYHVGRKSNGSDYNYVGLETSDGEYYVSLDMKSMRHPQSLLAYEMNGAPLKAENGAPLRLIIPIKYGIKSLKRVGRIFFSDERPPDYWAEEGYDWYSNL